MILAVYRNIIIWISRVVEFLGPKLGSPFEIFTLGSSKAILGPLDQMLTNSILNRLLP